MKPFPSFVHLHNHTEYSFLESTARVRDLVRRAREFHMPALAITDHGLFGAVEFYDDCFDQGIKPIFGMEALITPRPGQKKGRGRRPNKLILLAENNEGWKSLMRLSSSGFLDGPRANPIITTQHLRDHAFGIIAASACVEGAIPQALLASDRELARSLAVEYLEIFGENHFYLELQNHGLDEEKVVREGLIELGRELGIPLIATNDVRYLDRKDADIHELLSCIRTKTVITDPDHARLPSDQYWFKSSEKMTELFPDLPGAMSNTLDIAERCSVEFRQKVVCPMPITELSSSKLREIRPSEINDPATPEEYLTRIAREGLASRYERVTPELEERLDYELGVICDLGFAGVLLIQRHLVMEAHELGFQTGPRGPIAGCLVAYAIGITNVDPIRFNLLFERYMNPERLSLPTIFIDFADTDRIDMVFHTGKLYGRASVVETAEIVRMSARTGVRLTGKALGLAPDEIRMLTRKLRNRQWGEVRFTGNDPFKTACQKDDRYRELFRFAPMLDDIALRARIQGTTIAIAPGSITDYAPVFRLSKYEPIPTQFSSYDAEAVGLFTLEFHGLRALAMQQAALRLLREGKNLSLDLWKIPTDDPKTLELFGRGDTKDIFLFETRAMREYLRKIGSPTFDDLVALFALFRPGLIDAIDEYIRRKKGESKVRFPHPVVAEILKPTQGLLVFQEQLMRIAHRIGGLSLGQADILRRALGMRNAEKTEEFRKIFIDGAGMQGIMSETAETVFELLTEGGSWCFNQSHAILQVHVAFQSGYLKAHYPEEF